MELKFVEPSSGQPAALIKWFYPGTRDGHQFVYAPGKKRSSRRVHK
ncbi:MAG TPA: hypothetical protein VNZ56_11785 [Verrucomicrobiae bacterium]|jgi:hypothetical protein|nr:hypothetical protein [Verrucomicrobiae bacterium]